MAKVDAGKRTNVPTDMAAILKAVERENQKVRQAQPRYAGIGMMTVLRMGSVLRWATKPS
jgi:hypothetical protein